MRNIACYCSVILLAAAAGMSGCSNLEFASHWRTGDITIDGQNKEWDGLLTPLDDKLTSVGMVNDSSNLYIGLVTANRDLARQIMRRGITFWFDREGGKRKTFGIRFPLGYEGYAPSGDSPNEGSGQGEASRNERIAEASGELDLYGPREGDIHRMTLAEAEGIEVKAKVDRGMLVYEMKVPLEEDAHHPFAVGAKAGTLIGVGVETSSERQGERPSEGMTRGDGGGRGFGGRGRGGGGMGGGGRRAAPQSQAAPLDVWAKVQLSPRINAQ